MWYFCGVLWIPSTHVNKEEETPTQIRCCFREWIAYEFYATSNFPQWNFIPCHLITLPLQSGYSATQMNTFLRTYRIWSVNFLPQDSFCDAKSRQSRNAQTDTCFQLRQKFSYFASGCIWFGFVFIKSWLTLTTDRYYDK